MEHPTWANNSSIFPPLWNVALSIINTCPGLSTGNKQFSSHVSNTVPLQEPSTVKGAINPLNILPRSYSPDLGDDLASVHETVYPFPCIHRHSLPDYPCRLHRHKLFVRALILPILLERL